MSTCLHCGQVMVPADGVVPTWRCSCGRDIPRGVASQPDTHVVMFSGGAGSWAAAKRVAERHGTDNLKLLFADTLGEDADLYRFLIEGAGNVYGIDTTTLVRRSNGIPKVGDPRRKFFLAHLASIVHKEIPGFHWLIEGRTIWEVFRDDRFLGNSRLANCSKFLKQQPCREWLEINTDPENCHVHVGIDWSETHRVAAIENAYKPWQAHAPLCEKPYLSKHDIWDQLKAEGIRRPRLYDLGHPHNNCAGFCVRAGQAQFEKLLRHDREMYLQMEAEEEGLRTHLDKDVAVMKDRRGGDAKPLTMRQFREDRERQLAFDTDDWGGCGCFVAEAA